MACNVSSPFVTFPSGVSCGADPNVKPSGASAMKKWQLRLFVECPAKEMVPSSKGANLGSSAMLLCCHCCWIAGFAATPNWMRNPGMTLYKSYTEGGSDVDVVNGL